MISFDLHDFIEQASASGFIGTQDVDRLQQDILKNGLSSRIEAEALLALDRTVTAPDSWMSVLKGLVVDFVLWTPTTRGSLSTGDALWLTTVLEMSGPNERAMAIAYAVLDEARRVDSALLDFIMRGRQRARLVTLAA